VIDKIDIQLIFTKNNLEQILLFPQGSVRFFTIETNTVKNNHSRLNMKYIGYLAVWIKKSGKSPLSFRLAHLSTPEYRI
jgi:hypothetical protein